MTTYAAFLTALGDLAITGISIRLDEPPTAIKDLPCQWVQVPQAGIGPMTFQAHGGWPKFEGQLVIAYEAVAQDRQPTNWAGLTTVIDNLITALSGAVGTIAKGPINAVIRPGVVEVAGQSYWAVIAEVSING